MTVRFGQGTFVVDKNYVLNRPKAQADSVRDTVRGEEPLAALRALDDSLRLRFDVHYDYDGNGHKRDHGGEQIMIEHRSVDGDTFEPVKTIVRDMPREGQQRSWWKGGNIAANRGESLKDFLLRTMQEAAEYFELVSEIK